MFNPKSWRWMVQMIFRIFGGAEFQVPASSFRGKHDFFCFPKKIGGDRGRPLDVVDGQSMEIILLYHFVVCPPGFVGCFLLRFRFVSFCWAWYRLEYLHHFWSNEYVPYSYFSFSRMCQLSDHVDAARSTTSFSVVKRNAKEMHLVSLMLQHFWQSFVSANSWKKNRQIPAKLGKLSLLLPLPVSKRWQISTAFNFLKSKAFGLGLGPGFRGWVHCMHWFSPTQVINEQFLISVSRRDACKKHVWLWHVFMFKTRWTTIGPYYALWLT